MVYVIIRQDDIPYEGYSKVDGSDVIVFETKKAAIANGYGEGEIFEVIPTTEEEVMKKIDIQSIIQFYQKLVDGAIKMGFTPVGILMSKQEKTQLELYSKYILFLNNCYEVDRFLDLQIEKVDGGPDIRIKEIFTPPDGRAAKNTIDANDIWEFDRLREHAASAAGKDCMKKE
ncbi:MAG: hypothetical protein WC451_02675 [Patescibacteria group bacterium]|jgi:hypothetical protein